MDRLMTLMTRYAPDEGGGGSDDTVTVVVDGEERTMSRDVFSQIERGANWERTLTHRSETLSAREREVAARSAQVEEDKVSRSRTTREETRDVVREDAAAEAGIDVSDLPSPMDDPDAYNAALGKKLRQAADLGYQKAVRALRKTSSVTKEEVVNEIAHSDARRTDFQRNKDTIEGYCRRMEQEGTPLNAQQRKEMVEYMDTSLRLPAKGLCERGASGVIVFNEKAMERADAAVRSDYWRNRSKEEGLREGLQRAGSAEDADLSRNPPPDKKSSAREKVEYAISLPIDSKAQQRYVDSLTDAELNEFLVTQHQMELHEREVGSA